MAFTVEMRNRIEACALILADEKKAKIEAMAIESGATIQQASARYVVGILKASIRRGTAVNYEDALDRYEADQVGDRAVSVKGEASIVAEVRRINKINKVTGTAGATHKRNMAKVIGTIYVQWEAATEATAPEYRLVREAIEAEATRVDETIAAYLNEYVTRLSRTARASIRDIVHTHYGIDAIMAGKSPDTARMKERAKYIHRNFPKADDITTRELLGLLRKYAA